MPFLTGIPQFVLFIVANQWRQSWVSSYLAFFLICFLIRNSDKIYFRQSGSPFFYSWFFIRNSDKINFWTECSPFYFSRLLNHSFWVFTSKFKELFMRLSGNPPSLLIFNRLSNCPFFYLQELSNFYFFIRFDWIPEPLFATSRITQVAAWRLEFVR